MRAIGVGLALLLVTAPAGAQSPATPSTTLTIDYREPTTREDGTPLQGLKSIRLYWRLDGGPETLVTLPASSIKGGLERRLQLTVPATSGVVSISLTAVDAAGREGPRTAPVTKVLGASGGKE